MKAILDKDSGSEIFTGCRFEGYFCVAKKIPGDEVNITKNAKSNALVFRVQDVLAEEGINAGSLDEAVKIGVERRADIVVEEYVARQAPKKYTLVRLKEPRDMIRLRSEGVSYIDEVEWRKELQELGKKPMLTG